jgi:hypothetical protein
MVRVMPAFVPRPAAAGNGFFPTFPAARLWHHSVIARPEPLMRALALAALFCASPLAAETRQHGNVVFDVPVGWRYGLLSPTGTLALWNASDATLCPACNILIGTSAPATGTVEDHLAANTHHFVAPGLAYPPTVTPTEPAESFLLNGLYPAAVQRQWVDQKYLLLFAIQAGDRIDLVAFEIPEAELAEGGTGDAAYQQHFLPFLEGLRFVSEGALPLLPAAEPGSLYGVWWHMRSWTTQGWNYWLGTPTFQDHSRHQWLTLWPDGYFYDGAPPDGTQPLDPAKLAAEGRMNWGVYRQDGTQVTLTYASGETATFAVVGNALETRNGTTLAPIALYADGITIEGSVARLARVPPVPASGPIEATGVTFRPDFTWSSGGDMPVSGTYKVLNGLVLTYDQTGQLFGSDYLFQDPDGTIWVGTETLN